MILQRIAVAVFAAGLTGCQAPSAAAEPARPQTVAGRTDPGWPREVEAPVGRLVMYQPQIDGWKDDEITARMAIALFPQGGSQPHYGAIRLKGDTAVDVGARQVSISDIEIEGLDFPAEEVKEADVKKALVRLLPDKPVVLSLDRVQAALAAGDGPAARTPAVEVLNDPPAIRVVAAPAALVRIDGEPSLQPIPGTTAMSVVNTESDLLFDPAGGRYYLLIDDRWLSAPDLFGGPWTAAAALPASFAKIPADHPRTEAAAPMPAEPATPVPHVVVATAPTELIVTDGKTEYAPIPGTRLLYLKSAAACVFLLPQEQTHYVLLSGRWFRSADLSRGPWAFVPSDRLPADFAAIPDDHPMAVARVSVAGTPEAREALIAASIPRKAVVDRGAAKLAVAYVGEPVFAPVEGTRVAYAVNTTYDVLQVGGAYYCCYGGVWFVAAAPVGPWAVAAAVAPEIYTLPPSARPYHVTYVRVYGSTPTTVIVGVTPGYYGTYVTPTTVVYGTGHRYASAVVAGVWIGAAATWAACASYDHYHGGYVCGGWYHCSAHYSHCRAGYHATMGSVSGPRGEAAWVSGGARGYRRSQGAWAAAGSRNGHEWAAAGYRSSNPYESWGGAVVRRDDEWIRTRRYSNDDVTVRRTESSRGGQSVGVRTDQGVFRGYRNDDVAGVGVKTDDHRFRVLKTEDDVYVGRDGNVYRRSGDEWHKRGAGGWNPVPAAGAPPQPRPSTNDVEKRPPQPRPSTTDVEKRPPQPRPSTNDVGKHPPTTAARTPPPDVAHYESARSRGDRQTQLYGGAGSSRPQSAPPQRPQPSGGRRGKR